MDYSQPYGTPQPPAGTFPRYINGNPVTGTEGSIPPATAFDEDQIEIVNVILNAGLTPDHTDLTQLWQAIQSLLSQQYITTAVTKTVHGSGADFPDMIQALQWASNYTITSTGSILFMVAAGKWTYTQSIIVDHPQAQRITVQGGALLGATPTPGNISVTGYYQSADGSAQVVYLRSIHATELVFTGGVNGLYVRTNGMMFRYMLFTGSQTVAAVPPGQNYMFQGCGIYAVADIYLDGCSFWGFGQYGIYIGAAAIRLPTSLSLTICFCGVAGISMYAGSLNQAQAAWTILASCQYGGLSAYSSTTIFGLLCSKGHNSSFQGGGVACLSGSHVSAQVGSQIETCNGNGVCVVGGSDFLANQCTFSNMGGWGISAWGNATAWSDDSTFSNNTYGSAHASASAYIEVIGSTLGTGSQGATVPPVNTMDATGANVVH